MKKSFKRAAAIFFSMGIMSNPLFANQGYGSVNKNADITAHAESEWVKDALDTTLGTVVINDPQPAGTNPDGWAGDYLYYGKYNDSPVLYRILDTDTTVFSESQTDLPHTMLLDCDDILYDFQQVKNKEGSYSWSNCPAKTELNSNKFYLNPNYFSSVEKSAISASTKTRPIMTGDKMDGKGASNSIYSELNGDYIFFLDSKEITNKSYGYGLPAGPRKKYLEGKVATWWTRSFTETQFIYNLDNGGFKSDSYKRNDITSGVSPAFNISLDSVIFTSLVTPSTNTGDNAKWGNQYKLTLKDTNTVLATGNISKNGSTVTVPFTVNDLDSTDDITAEQVSVVFIGENNSIKQYCKLDSGTLDFNNGTAAGTGTFTLPDSFDADTDKIYVLAEKVNEGKNKCLTDYASELVELTLPTNNYELVPYVAPTYTTPGNIEYYTYEDKYYIKNGDIYTEINAEDIVIPQLKMTPSMYVSADSSRLLLNILVPIAKGYSVGDYVVTFADAEQELTEVNLKGVDYGKFTVECAAKEMSDDFSLVISADNAEICSKNVSVKSYLDEIITNDVYSSYQPTAKAMMRYGAAAQLYFNHNTTDLVNSDPTNGGIAGAEISELPDKLNIDSPTPAEFAEAFDLTYSDYYAMNMSFDSDTTLLIAFTIKSEPSDEAKNELANKFISKDYNVVVTLDNSEKFYIVKVQNIPIRKLGDPIFTFGEVEVKATDYLGRIADNTEKPDDLRNLCKALYFYYEASKSIPQ